VQLISIIRGNSRTRMQLEADTNNVGGRERNKADEVGQVGTLISDL